MCIRGGDTEASDHSGPHEADMHPETIERLAHQRVLAIGSLSPKAAAAVGACELAHRQWEAVDQGEGWIVRDGGQEMLPEALLDGPQVGSLTDEGGAMQLTQSGKEVHPVLAKVGEERRLLIQAQVFTDH